MQYELFNWELRLSDPSLSAQVTEADWLIENGRIRAAFMETILSHERSDVIERYVQTHQTGILHLSLALEKAAGQKGAERGRGAQRVAFLLSCLNALSEFLELYASKYLDPDAPLPLFRSGWIGDAIRKRMPFIREHLQSSEVSETLAEVILNLLDEALQYKDSLTYRQWYPLRELMEIVQGLPMKEGERQPGGMDMTDRLMECLYYLNVNTLPVYRYAKARMVSLVEEKTFAGEQVSVLRRIRRYFGWLEHKPGYRYLESRGSIIHMMSGWLEEFSRLKEKEAQESGEETAPDDSGFGLDSQKVITSLTVNELGLLVRLFMETGVFRTRNRKGLAKFMAQNVVTLNKEAHEEVSSNHLYGTLYSSTDATMDSVQAILNRMLVRLGKFRLEQRTKKAEEAKRRLKRK